MKITLKRHETIKIHFSGEETEFIVSNNGFFIEVVTNQKDDSGRSGLIYKEMVEELRTK